MSPNATGLNILSGTSSGYTALSIGRTAPEGVFGVAASNGQISDVAITGDVILRSATNNLILAARNATGNVIITSGTADSAKLTVTNAGNVGIGTTAPSKALDIVGASGGGIRLKQSAQIARPIVAESFYSGLTFENVTTTHAWAMGYHQGAGFGLDYFDGTSTYSNMLTVTATGLFGIGTTAPGNTLSVAGITAPTVNDTYSLGTDGLRWSDVYVGPSTVHIGTSTADEYTLAYNTSNNTLGFNVNGSGNPEIVMDSSGYLVLV